MNDIIAAIDAATGCQQCRRPLGTSPSGDFCSQDCQQAWHSARSRPLERYVEPFDLPAHAANQVELSSPETTPARLDRPVLVSGRPLGYLVESTGVPREAIDWERDPDEVILGWWRPLGEVVGLDVRQEFDQVQFDAVGPGATLARTVWTVTEVGGRVVRIPDAVRVECEALRVAGEPRETLGSEAADRLNAAAARVLARRDAHHAAITPIGMLGDHWSRVGSTANAIWSRNMVAMPTLDVALVMPLDVARLITVTVPEPPPTRPAFRLPPSSRSIIRDRASAATAFGAATTPAQQAAVRLRIADLDRRCAEAAIARREQTVAPTRTIEQALRHMFQPAAEAIAALRRAFADRGAAPDPPPESPAARALCLARHRNTGPEQSHRPPRTINARRSR